MQCFKTRTRYQSYLLYLAVSGLIHSLLQVAAELTKILLHLSDSFALPNFSSLRLKSLVAVAVLCPRQVAPYLTGQFYAPNYNIRQRMDMLEVSL